jgi:hypothetical protein
VQACAGAGKTRYVIDRVAALVRGGTTPESVYVFSFTNAAADEVSDRLRLQGIYGVQVSTFHSFAGRLVHRARGRPDVDEIESSLDAVIPEAVDLCTQDQSLLQGVRYVCVDEAQDLDEHKHNLCRQLLAQGVGALVVGDVNQSIFAFSGAQPQCFAHFFGEKTEPHIQTTLHHNYRSPHGVIALGNALIKELGRRGGAPAVLMRPARTVCGEEECDVRSCVNCGTLSRQTKPTLHAFATMDRQHTFVVNQVVTLVAKGVHPQNIAVVARLNNQLLPFFELVSSYAINARLVTDAQENSESADYAHVSLSTVHAAKGREWDYVFLVDANSTSFPFRHSDEHLTPEQQEARDLEELRLLYVAVTRAKVQLSVCFVRHRGACLSEFFTDPRLFACAPRLLADVYSDLACDVHSQHLHQLEPMPADNPSPDSPQCLRPRALGSYTLLEVAHLEQLEQLQQLGQQTARALPESNEVSLPAHWNQAVQTGVVDIARVRRLMVPPVSWSARNTLLAHMQPSLARLMMRPDMLQALALQRHISPPPKLAKILLRHAGLPSVRPLQEALHEYARALHKVVFNCLRLRRVTYAQGVRWSHVMHQLLHLTQEEEATGSPLCNLNHLVRTRETWDYIARSAGIETQIAVAQRVLYYSPGTARSTHQAVAGLVLVLLASDCEMLHRCVSANVAAERSAVQILRQLHVHHSPSFSPSSESQ